jgi:uncharacterized protein YndB with AHSA1/START domain
MAMAQGTLEDLVLDIEQTLEIKAAPGDVYEGLLRRLCNIEGDDGRPNITLTLERWPGGRWFRDLEGGTGHLWGIVQSIKPPTLIEFFGPTMMSSPVAGHLIVRLAPVPGGTQVTFRHQAFGVIPPNLRDGLPHGWSRMLASLKRDVER